MLFTGKVIAHYDGDTSSPSSLQEGAVFNLIKTIKKTDVSPNKLKPHQEYVCFNLQLFFNVI